MLGDHIRALRAGRWNHGIDCGDETILHASADAGAPRIVRTYRPQFVAGAEAVEVVAHREPVFAASSVVARAFSPIRDPAIASMFRDSEAFAHWCKTGRLPDAPRNVALDAAAAAPPAAAAREEAMPAPEPPRRKPARKKARAARKAPARTARPRRGSARKQAPKPRRPAPRPRRKGRR